MGKILRGLKFLVITVSWKGAFSTISQGRGFSIAFLSKGIKFFSSASRAVAKALREKQKLVTSGIGYPETHRKKTPPSFSSFLVIAPRTYRGFTGLEICADRESVVEGK